ncbi:hypothetical protein [Lactobacillus helveticus]|uniref:hypothetical protein n=1 Tax=Lactobacillus helveticus TaxID=1587 RepID=UPI0021A90E2B|nr:hypothetical protein [Lactobacillus helveticus]MCT3400971.1 hypothetical protein [Lactobacillus helveticus]
MTIDHLVFNRLKWFNVADNADSVKANNKDYVALPTSFTLPKDTYVSDGNHQSGMNISRDCEVTCVGSSNDFYYFCGKIFIDWNNFDSVEFDIDNPKDVENSVTFERPWFVRKSKVTNVKWGGKALLNHLYQWFRKLYRMVVIA